MTRQTTLPLWATFFTLLGILMLCTLGAWQLQRLEWKTDLLADIKAAYNADPMQFELTRRNLASLPENQQIIRGFAEGIYLHDAEILLGPRTHEGKPGYHLITPFETLDNAILLVNRGWVPLEAESSELTRPAGPVIITGIARKPEPASRFVPANKPDTGRWYRLVPAEIARAKKLENVLPYVLYRSGPPATAGYPLATAAKWQLPNNHLGYALFWFAMAGVLAVIYVLRFLYKRKD